MKTNQNLRPVLSLLLLASGLLLASTPVSAESAKSPLSNVAAIAKLPAETLLAEIKTTPFSAREALKAKLKDAETAFNARIPEWEAKKNALPEKKKRRSQRKLKKLVQMQEVLKQKIDGIDNAQEATWNSARHELHVALQKTISLFKKLQTQFDS